MATRYTAAQKSAHQARVQAITELRDQVVQGGHPADLRMSIGTESTQIIEHMGFGGMARLIVRFGAGRALYIDSLDEPGRFKVDQYDAGDRNVSSITDVPGCDDIDAVRVIRVYHRFLARYGLPERESYA